MQKMKEIIGDYETFIQRISAGLAAVGIARSELAEVDHICYRVETKARYDEMLRKLSGSATLLGESNVGGRKIATLELDDHLEVDGWIVPCIELPEPKEGSPYAEGLEHAELVVIGSLGKFAQRHATLPFETKDKDINPELGLKADLLSVKFHDQQLSAVVRMEQILGR
jgi:predicted metalloenzyme YecM